MLPHRIATPRLTLRPFTPADADDVFQYWRSDPDWPRFNLSVPDEFTRDDARKFVEDVIARSFRDSPVWAIEVSGHAVGVVSLSFDLDFTNGQLGYGIHGDLRGKGLVVEAVEAVMDKAVETHPSLASFCALTDEKNVASHRVLEKLGFAPVDDESGGSSWVKQLRDTESSVR